MDTKELGEEIVAITRKARFAGTTMAQWGERLTALIARQPEVTGEVDVANVREVGTAAGGSNGTLLFSVDYRTAEGPQSRQLVLRFLPAEGLFHEYDVAAQFNLQRALAKAGFPVPPQLWLDAEGRFLTRPGYVMEQVPGISPPMAWRTSGVLADASLANRRAMTLDRIGALAKLHAVDWRGAGLEWLEQRGKGRRPIEREVNWYWDAMEWSGDQEYRGRLEAIRDWLIANEPEGSDTVLCHGDATLGNCMFADNKVSAIVDWEMSFLGTPECDLTYFNIAEQFFSGDPWLDGALTIEECYSEYERLSGRKLRHIDYFNVFGAYRLGVINVLCKRAFSEEVLGIYLPVLNRGMGIVMSLARSVGALKD